MRSGSSAGSQGVAVCDRLARMTPRRRLLIAAIAIAWLLLGPLAMAFGGCLAMADCEALCGMLPGALAAPAAMALAAGWTALRRRAAATVPAPLLLVPEPPPRFIPA